MSKKKVHSFSNDALGNLDAFEISNLLKKSKISAKEVVESTINRANKVNPQIKAVVYENYDKALESAGKNKDGFFAGVPIYFKDMAAVKGMPTTYGSEALEGAKASKKNDGITEKILSMGFVNMGMSTMPEFGFTSSTEFPNLENTANPWNIERSVGGSSGGAAALVAAGVVPMAHTADGGGSTRIPASCCGLVGLKASRGRLLRSKLTENQVIEIAIDGVVSRSVRDTAYFYDEAEKYYYNKKLPKIGLVTEATTKKLNIGFIEGPSTGGSLDAATGKALNETVSLLNDLGHNLIPVKFPVDEQMISDFKLLWASNGFAIKHFGKLIFPAPYNSKKLTPFTNGLSEYYFKRILQTPLMLNRLRKTYASYQQFLQKNKIDIMLTPTMLHLTPKLGYLDMNLDFQTILDRIEKWSCFTPYSNANGCPSISLPICHDEKHDLPIGMLLWANHGADKLLLELSYQIEYAKPWKKIYE